MSSDQSHRRPAADPAHEPTVSEAVAPYRSTPSTIDNDTRLASSGDTEAMWTTRPARSSVIRSLQRSADLPSKRRENAPYRGDCASSHTRRDLLTGDWTIFAPKRDERPNEFAGPAQTPHSSLPISAAHSSNASQAIGTDLADGESASPRNVSAVDSACPFCQGAESQTPEAVWSGRIGEMAASASDHATNRFARPQIQIVNGEQVDWDVRVVPNKFPAVTSPELARNGIVDRHDLFPIAEVVGGHEVIVESATHSESITSFDSSLVYATLTAYRDRIRHWRDVPGINYISVFKNCGPDAGASLRHSHSQLIATSLMPHHIRNVLLRTEHHRARTGCSLGCDLLRAEMDEKSRVVDRTDSLVAFCPFASRFAGMVRITSAVHQPHFEALGDADLDQLASFLWRVLNWVGQAYPGKAYNYLINTCPPGSQQPESFQWSLDVFPRLSKTAGFEWSSDCMINSLLPEAAAERYRKIARRNDPRYVLGTR